MGRPALRRAQAMQQWTSIRTHDEYRGAMESVRGGSDWRAFWAINRRSLVPAVRVHAGEAIHLERHPMDADAVRNLANEFSCPLLKALVDLDVDGVARSLQQYDPLSWHCECPPGSARWQRQRYWPASPHAPAVPGSRGRRRSATYSWKRGPVSLCLKTGPSPTFPDQKGTRPRLRRYDRCKRNRIVWSALRCSL